VVRRPRQPDFGAAAYVVFLWRRSFVVALLVAALVTAGVRLVA
jgi:hypothetical protein